MNWGNGVRAAIAGVVAIAIFGGAFAIASAASSDEATAEGVPAAECQEAAAMQKELYGTAPESFYPDCPSPDEIRAAYEDAQAELGGFSVEQFKEDCVKNESEDFGACAQYSEEGK